MIDVFKLKKGDYITDGISTFKIVHLEMEKKLLYYSIVKTRDPRASKVGTLVIPFSSIPNNVVIDSNQLKSEIIKRNLK